MMLKGYSKLHREELFLAEGRGLYEMTGTRPGQSCAKQEPYPLTIFLTPKLESLKNFIIINYTLGRLIKFNFILEEIQTNLVRKYGLLKSRFLKVLCILPRNPLTTDFKLRQGLTRKQND